MSDIKVSQAQTLEILKAEVLKRVGHQSKAETFDELAQEVARLQKFVLVPEEIVSTIEDMRAGRTSGAETIFGTSLKARGMDPRWEDALKLQNDEVVEVERVKCVVQDILGVALRSKYFRTLAKELDGHNRRAEIPVEFVAMVMELAEAEARRIARDKELEAEAIKDAGPEEELLVRLVKLAKGEGLIVGEEEGVDGLLGRLRKLAGVSTSVARKLEPIERGLAASDAVGKADADEGIEEPEDDGPEDGGIPDEEPDIDESKDEIQQQEGLRSEAMDVPAFIENFSYSMYRIGWMGNGNPGEVRRGEDLFTLEPYGYAIMGPGRAISLGVPKDPGIAAFFMHDPISGVSAAGKLPYVDDFDSATCSILETARRMKAGRLGTPSDKTRFAKLKTRMQEGMAPHDYEFWRLIREFGNLSIPPERLEVGVVLFAGQPERSGYGVPPAQAMIMLGAMHASSIRVANVAMYRLSTDGAEPMVFDQRARAATVGGAELITLDDSPSDLAHDAIHYGGRLTGAMEELEVPEWIAETVRNYHLPLALGLWAGEWSEFNERIYDLVEGAVERKDNARRKLMIDTYKRWHAKIPEIARDDQAAGGGGSKGGKVGGAMRVGAKHHDAPHVANETEHDEGLPLMSGCAVATGFAGLSPSATYAGFMPI